MNEKIKIEWKKKKIISVQKKIWKMRVDKKVKVEWKKKKMSRFFNATLKIIPFFSYKFELEVVNFERLLHLL